MTTKIVVVGATTLLAMAKIMMERGELTREQFETMKDRENELSLSARSDTIYICQTLSVETPLYYIVRTDSRRSINLFCKKELNISGVKYNMVIRDDF